MSEVIFDNELTTGGVVYDSQSYTIPAFVAATMTSSWDMVGGVTANKAASWNIVSAVTKTLTANYNIIESVYAIKTCIFNTQEAVVHNLTSSYSIAYGVSISEKRLGTILADNRIAII